jgi:hypothetical protein
MNKEKIKRIIKVFFISFYLTICFLFTCLCVVWLISKDPSVMNNHFFHKMFVVLSIYSGIFSAIIWDYD